MKIGKHELHVHSYALKAFGIQKELDHKFLEVQAILASGLGPEANGQGVLDAIKRTLYPDVKSDIEELMEKHRKYFDPNADQMMTIRVNKSESILLNGKK